TSIPCSTIPTNGTRRSRPRCGRTRISRSITSTPRTATPSTLPTCPSRTCCPTRPASRSAIRRSPKRSSATMPAATGCVARPSIETSQKGKRAGEARFPWPSIELSWSVLRRRRRRRVLLQLFLKLLLALRIDLRVGRRTIEGLAEIGQREREVQTRIVDVDRLDVEGVALLELVLHVLADLIDRNAAFEAGDELGGRIRLLRLIDEDARAELEHHAERQRDAHDLRRALCLGKLRQGRRRAVFGPQQRARDAKLPRLRLAQLRPG